MAAAVVVVGVVVVVLVPQTSTLKPYTLKPLKAFFTSTYPFGSTEPPILSRSVLGEDALRHPPAFAPGERGLGGVEARNFRAGLFRA